MTAQTTFTIERTDNETTPTTIYTTASPREAYAIIASLNLIEYPPDHIITYRLIQHDAPED